jgi:NAD(P)-dependent dehydrogenase (short-subunit alcohol dehydrogenase family)
VAGDIIPARRADEVVPKLILSCRSPLLLAPAKIRQKLFWRGVFEIVAKAPCRRPINLASDEKPSASAPRTCDRIAVVTGAYSGIGAATADLLASRGFRVLRAGLKPGQGDDDLLLDLRLPSSIAAAVDSIWHRVDHVDVLVNCAGSLFCGALEETAPDDAREQFETNFFGLTALTREMLGSMRSFRDGRIINVSSVAGFFPSPFLGFYAASKHALEAYSEALDYEMRAFGVRSILIQPGLIRTGIFDKSRSCPNQLEAYGEPRRRFLRRFRRRIAEGSDPALVAQVIYRAATSPNPRRRYRVGKGAALLWNVRRWAPDSFRDYALSKLVD